MPDPSSAEAVRPRPRPGMVSWYDPAQLFRTGIDVVLSTILARRADFRMLESLTPAQEEFDHSNRTEIGIDYVSDVGDGWHSTFAIAHLLARPSVLDLPRGDILIMGGDEVYPVASRSGYEDRLVGPYVEASIGFDPNVPAPELFAIPGNHDWYDGLVSFTRRFCAGRTTKIGAWQTPQKRSYFAIALPHRYWLFAVDIQLEADIDDPQLDYFRKITEKMKKDDRVILCTAEPDWIHASHYEQPDFSKNMLLFHELVQAHGGRIVAQIAGDVHHYRRHESSDGVQYITAGGGGAFLHPTFPSRPTINAVNNVTLTEKERYPSPGKSFALGFRNLLFPIYNRRLGLVTAGLYAVLAASMPMPSTTLPFTRIFGEALVHMLEHGSAFVIVALTLGAFIAFTDTHKAVYRWIGGAVHGAAHLSAALSLTWLARIYLIQPLPGPDDMPWLNALTYLVVALLGYTAGTFLLGAYLCISFCVFRRHWNESFSSLRIEGYKNFLRMKIDHEGTLSIHALKLEDIPTKWGRGMTDKLDTTLLKPELIETIVIKK